MAMRLVRDHFKDGNDLGQEHIYSIFTVHAVSMDALLVTADTSAAVVGFALNFDTPAKAALIGLYQR